VAFFWLRPAWRRRYADTLLLVRPVVTLDRATANFLDDLVIREAELCPTSAPSALPYPRGRRWSLFGATRKLSSHPRQHYLPRRLRNPHTRHQDDRPGEQLDAIRRNRVAFRVALGRDPLLSRVKRRLFASCPRHFTQARPSLARACCFSGGILPPLRPPGHPWHLPAVSCAATLPPRRPTNQIIHRLSASRISGSSPLSRYCRHIPRM